MDCTRLNRFPERLRQGTAEVHSVATGGDIVGCSGSLGMAPIAARNRALSINCQTSTAVEQMKQHSRRDDEIIGGGIPHVFAFVPGIERIAVSHFFTVAEDILTIDSPVGKPPQNLLEVLSQSPDPGLYVTEPVVQNAPVIKRQVAFHVLGVVALCGQLNGLYVLVSRHPCCLAHQKLLPTHFTLTLSTRLAFSGSGIIPGIQVCNPRV